MVFVMVLYCVVCRCCGLGVVAVGCWNTGFVLCFAFVCVAVGVGCLVF